MFALKSAQPPFWTVALGFALAGGIAALLAGQDISWDLQNYHLYNAYAFLGERYALDLMPAGAQSFFNPWLDVLFWWGVHGPGPAVTGFLTGALQGLSLAMVYLIAGRLLDGQGLPRSYALPLAVLGGLSVGFLSEIGTVFHDSTLALLTSASLWLVLRDYAPRPFQRSGALNLLLAGLLMGVACGLKPVMVMFAAGLCAALLLNGLALITQFRSAFLFGLGVVAGLALASGSWWYQVWTMMSNPLFPLMNQVFEGPLAQPLSMRDERFLPKTVLQAVVYPLHFTLDPYLVAERYYRLVAWLVLYLLYAAWLLRSVYGGSSRRQARRKPGPAMRLVLLYLAFSYLLWLKVFSIYRYLVPIEILLPLVSLMLAHVLFERLQPRLVLAGLLVISLFSIQAVPSWGRTHWSGSYYAIEEPADAASLSSVMLMGQPLAWLVPAFAEDLPFIQISPNFGATQDYWREVHRRSDFSGTVRVIFDPEYHTLAATRARVHWLGYQLDLDSCVKLRAGLGSAWRSYQYCEVVGRVAEGAQ